MTAQKFLTDLMHILSTKRYPLQSEKLLQLSLAKDLLGFEPEFELHRDIGIIDFFNAQYGIGVEVKIGGNRRQIYEQCKRYCVSGHIKFLVLVTNRSMGLPSRLVDKPCYVVNLGRAWL